MQSGNDKRADVLMMQLYLVAAFFARLFLNLRDLCIIGFSKYRAKQNKKEELLPLLLFFNSVNSPR